MDSLAVRRQLLRLHAAGAARAAGFRRSAAGCIWAVTVLHARRHALGGCLGKRDVLAHRHVALPTGNRSGVIQLNPVVTPPSDGVAARPRPPCAAIEPAAEQQHRTEDAHTSIRRAAGCAPSAHAPKPVRQLRGEGQRFVKPSAWRAVDAQQRPHWRVRTSLQDDRPATAAAWSLGAVPCFL